MASDRKAGAGRGGGSVEALYEMGVDWSGGVVWRAVEGRELEGRWQRTRYVDGGNGLGLAVCLVSGWKAGAGREGRDGYVAARWVCGRWE